MIREEITKEVQSRISSIKTGNGYAFSIIHALRNPDNPPDPDSMPCAHIFEAADRVVSTKIRGASVPPIQIRKLSIISEYWYKSTSEGQASIDISLFLEYSRYALFNDGVTLGGLSTEFIETENTRVLRPGISNHVIGIGCTYSAQYVEDFNLITI